MLKEYLGKLPTVHPDAWVADEAIVIGDVVVGKESSIWFGTIVRGDVAHVRIGERTNIQDHCTIHVTRDAHPAQLSPRMRKDIIWQRSFVKWIRSAQ